jgi:integrase
MRFLTAEQVTQLADEIAEPHGLMVLFAAYSGLRAGEIGALRVKNLDLMRLRVTVEESVSEVPGLGLVYGPTKTYARRTLTLPSFLREPLTEYVAPRAKDPNAFVFVGSKGGTLRHSDFYARFFRPAVEHLADRRDWTERLRGLRFHDLRHTAASLLINPPIEAHPKVIQQRLGHSSINTTFDRYGHLFPGLDEELGEKLDALHIASIEKPDVEVATLLSQSP